jgi:16S rRNA (guanine966-N2)-methyltransferase
MTRIIGGEYGGRRLVTPDGRDTRPTADRVREALFNTLQTLVDLSGARFADLYAGSGAVGLEAASRGASHVLLVEDGPAAARAARSNIAALGAGAVVTLTAVKVERLAAKPPERPFDVIFADPPYALADDALAEVLAGLAGNGWLAPEGLLVVERATRAPQPRWPAEMSAERTRRYGETTLWYGRRS